MESQTVDCFEDRLRFNELLSERYVYRKLTAENLEKCFSEGLVVGEDSHSVRAFKSGCREIIPVDLYAPDSTAPLVRSNRFSFTTNQAFATVVERCARLSGSSGNTPWIGSQFRAALIELNQRQKAHSIEIYEGTQLVGGAVGAQVGGFYKSLSLFGNNSSAKNASLIVLKVILCERSFGLHDVDQPSALSRHFGGRLVGGPEYEKLQAGAKQLHPVFPGLDQKVPLSILAGPK